MDKLQMSPRVAIALVVVLALILGLTMCGCAGAGITGGGFLSGSGTDVRVLNSTKYTLMVAYRNQEITLRPGQYHIANLPNYLNGTGISVVIQVITHQNGEVLTASNPYPVYPDSHQEYGWEVQEWELR